MSEIPNSNLDPTPAQFAVGCVEQFSLVAAIGGFIAIGLSGESNLVFWAGIVFFGIGAVGIVSTYVVYPLVHRNDLRR